MGNSTPVFSARYNDPDSTDVAEDYQLIVYSENTCTTQVWDSTQTSMTPCTQGNHCLTATNLGIEYGDTPLDFDGMQYWWKIRYWDDSDAQGAYSGCLTDYFYILGPANLLRHGNYFFNDEEEGSSFKW